MSQHFAGVRARLIGNVNAAEHARDLVDSVGRTQGLDARACHLPIGVLNHSKLRVGLGGHLRKMRDTKHLRASPQFAQLAADDFRGAAANTGIDLVEHHAQG